MSLPAFAHKLQSFEVSDCNLKPCKLNKMDKLGQQSVFMLAACHDCGFELSPPCSPHLALQTFSSSQT